MANCPSDRRATWIWLNFMFWCARRAQRFMRYSEWAWLGLSHVAFRRALRDGPTANAKWLLGPGSTPRQRRRLVNRVIRQFYRFIYDVGRTGAMSHQQILDQIGTVHDRKHYDAVRARQCGAIFVTAHLGSYEVGMAAIADLEPGVHVVFQQDVFSAFDAIRDQLHRKVGVTDAPVERGVDVWMTLRDVLADDRVVLMQGDRVMPGHKGVAVPFMGGHIEMPMGPIKLAALSGAPLLPVFAIRQDDGQVRLIIEPAIEVRPEDARPGAVSGAASGGASGGGDAPPPPLLKLASVIEKHVRAHPEQWLMLHPRWLEDTPAPGSVPGTMPASQKAGGERMKAQSASPAISHPPSDISHQTAPG